MNSDSRSGVLAVLAALAGIALAPLTGCATPGMTKSTGAWVGHPIAELHQQWGEPSSRHDLGQGRVEWMWPGYEEKPHGWTFVCLLRAFVNRSGEIYRMEHSCPPGTASPDVAGRKVPPSRLQGPIVQF